MPNADIGLWGLAVMGKNLALNMAEKGFTVAVYNRTANKTRAFAGERAPGKKVLPAYSVREFVGSLKSPRKVMIMVKAGPPVDEVIGQIVPFLSRGDLVIDGGNSYFKDSIRRHDVLQKQGLWFLGTGISGGEQGALLGPSIMPGGSREGYALAEGLLTRISAKVEGTPCCAFMGEGGAGHFVKMVHNGIEYADMQLIAEAYALMREVLALPSAQMQQVFAQWNQGELDSYLIEITADILSKKDGSSGQDLVEVIQDRALQKGTGAWTAQSALELGVATPTIAEAVFARAISALKQERVQASKLFTGPRKKWSGNKESFIRALHEGLYASKICAYAQGFALMTAAAKEYGWHLPPGTIALIWRGGCIIRARFLNRIKEAYDRQSDLCHLLRDDYFREVVQRAQESWRRVVRAAVEAGVPVPCFSAALHYFDSYRADRLSANLLQAQRDYFGAHGYERIDQEGIFHTDWQA